VRRNEEELEGQMYGKFPQQGFELAGGTFQPRAAGEQYHMA